MALTILGFQQDVSFLLGRYESAHFAPRGFFLRPTGSIMLVDWNIKRGLRFFGTAYSTFYREVGRFDPATGVRSHAKRPTSVEHCAREAQKKLEMN